jgi:hypothetical protein
MIASDTDTGVTLKCAVSAAIAVAVLLAWQAFIVFFGYGGDWTALFMTGDSGPAAVPPALVSTTHIFKNNPGYDGQFTAMWLTIRFSPWPTAFMDQAPPATSAFWFPAWRGC